MRPLIHEMPAEELSEALRETDVVILPIGSVEQHGPHLPTGTDTIIPVELARMVAERVGALVAPPIFYGNSVSMKGMPGVLTVSPESLSSYLLDVCKSLARLGFKIIVVMNGHGGNTQVVDFVGHRVREETGAVVVRVDWWRIASREIREVCSSPVAHADEGETSVMLALKPSLVRMERAVRDDRFRRMVDRLTGGKPENMPKVYLPFEMLTETGILGDATKASREKGLRIVEAVVENTVNLIRELRNLLEERRHRQPYTP